MVIERVKDPELVFRERLERLEKTYMNKRPDRVPFNPSIDATLFASYAGTTVANVAYDWDTFFTVSMKWARDFNVDGIDVRPSAVIGLEMMLLTVLLSDYPDLASALRFWQGPYHDILRDRYTRWPGRELGPDTHPQFIGGEFMKPEEYRYLIDNPMDFIFSTVIPRAFEVLKNIRSVEALAALTKLGVEVRNYQITMAKIGAEARKLGWPTIPMGFGYAPLDFIGDFMRHITGILLDVRRRPDDVLAAVETLTPWIIKAMKATTIPPDVAKQRFGTPVVLVFFPLHLNEMLSPKMYNEFYWPTLKKIINEVINMGATPYLWVEGDHTPHIETFLELPKGRVYARFEKTDLRLVRKKLGDHVVIGGGISTSLFLQASKEKVYEEVCKLLNDVKEPGGFIFMGPNAYLPKGTKIENIWAAVEAVIKCGEYR